MVLLVRMAFSHFLSRSLCLVRSESALCTRLSFLAMVCPATSTRELPLLAARATDSSLRTRLFSRLTSWTAADTRSASGGSALIVSCTSLARSSLRFTSASMRAPWSVPNAIPPFAFPDAPPLKIALSGLAGMYVFLGAVADVSKSCFRRCFNHVRYANLSLNLSEKSVVLRVL